MKELLHRTLTKTLIGVYYEVYRELGHGFLESVYERAYAVALEARGLRYARQVPVDVWYRDRKIGVYFADIIVEQAVIIELKAARAIDEAHENQMLNYLRATEIEVGLLFNFGPRPEFRRLLFTNDRKTSHGQNGRNELHEPTV